ncbi:uncharacterized protein PAC_08565 [Phialocephala subalpina]|uniref:Gylcosyl hydrolase 115 C-terminal domain-containing protein n=1 Tax=Phialocephala subalpina TaxID=576137 RepID=A0A1L7X0X8_9HELO|nr:uncharacterized protein PAC_08565 [Phialocephala subalpina]
MFGEHFITFQGEGSHLNLVGAPVIVGKDDFQGVQIAASLLCKDFAAVTGHQPEYVSYATNTGISCPIDDAIIVGSLQSSLVQNIIRESELAIDDIQGCWEAFFTIVVEKPLQGCKRALMIVGSDKRGAIFGIYTLSEQMGVSPWYWWADVVPTPRSQIFAKQSRTRRGSPSVKYRGIFINDEAPSLTGWVLEKMGTCYGVEFYEKVFELLLRLKANFLWPAMWPGYPNPGNSFFKDDPLNQKTADIWGIVISTSHHEPMQRAMAEWFEENPEGSWSYLKSKEKIQQYFKDGAERAHPYESYITIGMRGDGDRAMAVDDPASVLAEIIKDQRRIIADTYGSADQPRQLLALYKEVQEYFENGLEVPEDVTLLFADDNFGTIRRLPTSDEAERKGRAGGRIWQQLYEAYRRGADQIWVFNVGDIKPLELPLTFSMELAWNVNSIATDDFMTFFKAFADREFSPSISEAVAELLYGYDRLIALRKHEHIESDTFSLLNYSEAENIIADWKSLLDRAQSLYSNVQSVNQPAFFQLVLHPIKASYIYTKLRVGQAKNQLFALQRRNEANVIAQEVLRLFDEDFDLSEEFHHLLGGKWNHMMRQPHYGYRETWHAPSRDMISGLCFVQTRQDSNPISGYMGVAVEGTEGIRPGLTNEESDRTHPSRKDLVPGLTLPTLEPFGQQSRYFEVYRRGTSSLTWHLKTPYDWLIVSPSTGILDDKNNDSRITVKINWLEVPFDFQQTVQIEVSSTVGDYEHVHLPITNRNPPDDSFSGFMESDGSVTIEASSFCRPARNELHASNYQILPFLGRTRSGVVTLSQSVHPMSATNSEFLEYDFWTFSEYPRQAILTIYFTMTLDTSPKDPLCFEIMIDDCSSGSLRLIEDPGITGDLPPGWLLAVQDGVWKKNIDIGEMTRLKKGSHIIKLRIWQQNLLVEKLVLNLGGVRDSYLGPPESTFVSRRQG